MELLPYPTRGALLYYKIKIHSGCEIKGFVETHTRYLQAVCDTPIACITGCVSSLYIHQIQDHTRSSLRGVRGASTPGKR